MFLDEFLCWILKNLTKSYRNTNSVEFNKILEPTAFPCSKRLFFNFHLKSQTQRRKFKLVGE